MGHVPVDNYMVAMGLCTAGVISAYAIARLTAILFPPKDGRNHFVTVAVTGVCLLIIVALVIAGAALAEQYFAYTG